MYFWNDTKCQRYQERTPLQTNMKQSSCITAFLANMRRQVYAMANSELQAAIAFGSSRVLLCIHTAMQLSYHKIYTLNIRNKFQDPILCGASVFQCLHGHHNDSTDGTN